MRPALSARAAAAAACALILAGAPYAPGPLRPAPPSARADARRPADPLPLPPLTPVPGMGRGDGRGVPAAVDQSLATLRARASLAPDPDGATKEREGAVKKLDLRGKVKDCCGYPLGEPRTFKMTFYWVAWESEYANEIADVPLYTRDGFFIGTFPRTFVFELKLEGSGILRDGRVLNYDGRCEYGIGVCFQALDARTHPLGKGGQGRALWPFRSVAVDVHWVPLGTPLYVPELRGLLLPDGTRHDGCVRADDTGGNIRRRELDLFVESYATWKFFEDQLWNDTSVTPLVEEPRCDYLRREQPGSDPSTDRRSESTDWAAIHDQRILTKRRDPVTGIPKQPSKPGAGDKRSIPRPEKPDKKPAGKAPAKAAKKLSKASRKGKARL